MQKIYHIAQRDEWEKAKALGSYWPAVPSNCPFIHFSFESQVTEVANALFAGRKDLVLLEVNGEKVKKDLKLERADAESEEYPHLYRALKTHEVCRESPFLPSANGTFRAEKR